jgi:AraC family transcriptional regulator
MTPRIEQRPALHLVGMRGRFTRETTHEIPALWARFAPRMGHVPRSREPGVSYGVCAATGGEAFEYTACVEADALAVAPEGMVGLTLAPATYAVFTHAGPIREIGATWEAIHARWLPAAGLRALGRGDGRRAGRHLRVRAPAAARAVAAAPRTRPLRVPNRACVAIRRTGHKGTRSVPPSTWTRSGPRPESSRAGGGSEAR